MSSFKFVKDILLKTNFHMELNIKNTFQLFIV